MIYAAPSATFAATVADAATGLVGTIGVRIENSDGTNHTPRTVAGVVEVEAGSGTYVKADLVAPAVAGTYIVLWDTGGADPDFASEELVVTTSVPVVAAGDLLDRVKARVDTDLADPELQLLIDEALQEIEDRYGPPSDPNAPITVQLEGRRNTLSLARPIDTAEPVVVTEYITYLWDFLGSEETTVLDADDYRVWHSGRTLERLRTGTNPRWLWGSRVEVEYTPKNDGNQRQEVTIKLVELAVTHQGGLRSIKVGDYSKTWAGDEQGYQRERASLLNSLAPRSGLMFR